MAIPGGNPAPLGQVTVASSGTPVPLNTNFSDLGSDEAVRNQTNQCSWVFVQANPANAGLCFIGNANMNIATKAGVYLILAAGASASIQIGDVTNGLNINDFYVDADNNDDWVIATMGSL
jgi:hypothetical protein